MPKRIVDGEGMWRSTKIKKVQPEGYRQEYAWLLPIALANGVFEADPDAVWATAYAFLRPSITPETVKAIFDEFERVDLLRRWTHTDGKVWGWWVGIDKPGRLPKPSDLKDRKYEVGPNVPNELKDRAPTSPQQGPNRAQGIGKGLGEGLGEASPAAKSGEKWEVRTEEKKLPPKIRISLPKTATQNVTTRRRILTNETIDWSRKS